MQNCPFAWLKKNLVSVVAERDLGIGDIVIPIFCRRPNSVVAEGEWQAHSYTSVQVDVEWKEPNVRRLLEERGWEGALSHSVVLWVREEFRLPKKDDPNEALTGQEDLHPFWAIKRQAEGEEINCQICRQNVELLVSADFGAGLKKIADHLDGVQATMSCIDYPFIVNTRRVRAGEALVLKVAKAAPKEQKKRLAVNAFDQLKSKYKKIAAPKSAASASG